MRSFVRKLPLLAVAAIAVTLLGACTSSQLVNFRKGIAVTNDVQTTAADALDEANRLERAAGALCGAKALTLVPPVTPSFAVCHDIGAPLPFDPDKLNAVHKANNALYDVIRGAAGVEAALTAGSASPADVAAAKAGVVDALRHARDAAKDAGLILNWALIDAAIAALAAGV